MHQPIDEYARCRICGEEHDSVCKAKIEKKIWSPICPDCGRPHPDGDAIENCLWVVGRRGWRKLGEYDG